MERPNGSTHHVLLDVGLDGHWVTVLVTRSRLEAMASLCDCYAESAECRCLLIRDIYGDWWLAMANVEMSAVTPESWVVGERLPVQVQEELNDVLATWLVSDAASRDYDNPN